MSARRAFIPRPPSRVLYSEAHPLTTDARARDGDKDMFIDGNGKARSISAFLGQKRGTGTEAASQGAEPTQGASLGRANTTLNRRSFEGILRPPTSIIPNPATPQFSTGLKQPGAGQTPRKTAGPGAFEFQRPMTPVSVPKKGVGKFAENQQNESISNGNALESDNVFIEPEGEADVRLGAEAGIGGYMRFFEESGDGESAGGLQSSVEHSIVAPVPGYALAGLGENPEDGACEIDGIFAHSSRSLGAMVDAKVGKDKATDTLMKPRGAKRRMGHEDIEEGERAVDKRHQTQGSTKRIRQVQHDPDVSDFFIVCFRSG